MAEPLTLDQLKANDLPHCRITDVLKVSDESDRQLAGDERTTLTDYFADFLPPGPCVSCGSKLGSEDTIVALLDPGTFTWGIVNGEGNCSKCGYPARGYHRDVGPIKFFDMILQYHPSVLEPADTT